MASAGTRAAALLFSFSAVVLFLLLLLLQAPPRGGLADLVVSALDRFLDGRGRGRGLLELATRRNMILLCHAILLVILRDAGVLGTPARRRSRSSLGEATASAVVAAAGTETAAPARPHATRSAVVWRRRPRYRAAAPMHDSAAAARRLVECQPAAATWAAPVLTTGPPAPAQAAEEAAAVATQQTVLAESPRNDDGDGDELVDHHGRDAVVEPFERPTAVAVDGERDCDDRRIVAVAEKRMEDTTAREQQTGGTEMGMATELADDRAFEEFIESQRRKMRQESLQPVGSGGYHYQAILV